MPFSKLAIPFTQCTIAGEVEHNAQGVDGVADGHNLRHSHTSHDYPAQDKRKSTYLDDTKTYKAALTVGSRTRTKLRCFVKIVQHCTHAIGAETVGVV